ncbi:MAG: peptidoglycan DD-metalloendopeptidase family protein [Rhodobacteraceae bacterium]|nr:peptidoglycan DD-metalloendopeptidase family protein [Paracoccaceae bacterium]
MSGPRLPLPLPALAIALALGLALGLGPALAPAAAGDAAAAARAAAAALAAAGERLAAAAGAGDRIAALTATIRAYEEGLAALREGLRPVALREAELDRGLAARRTEIARLVGALAAIERMPAPALVLHPDGPLATARLGMLIAEVTPALQAEAEGLAAELGELATLRGVQEGALATLEEGLAAVADARSGLARAVAERRDPPLRAAESPAELAAMAAGAATLAAFADLLADRRLDPGGAAPDFPSLRGTLPLPVRGTLLRRAGKADAAGIRRPGLVLATAPRALVTAPAAATIRYLGPLLDYGNVMILEPGTGYLMVLAGLGEVYGAVGEVVQAGSPVGLMGGREVGAGEFLVGDGDASAGGRGETLYLELRLGAEPVDPGPWFEATR